MSWLLSDIITEICERAGVPAELIDTTQVEDIEVYGFSMTNSYSAFAGLEALAKIYFFDCANFDGVLHFIPRGGESVATITEDELIDEGSETVKLRRLDTMSIPRVMHLEYYDSAGGLNTDKQTSERSYDIRSKGEIRLSSTVIMNADTAAGAVVKNHKVAIEEQRGGKELTLPEDYLKLVPSNIITYEGERLRINEITIDDGQQKVKTSYDRQSAYIVTDVSGIQVKSPGNPGSAVIGDTVLYFIDSHILRDADDELGAYIAISGTTEKWSGALIEVSIDGGATYIQSMTAIADCINGELAESLPSHPRDYPDEINTTTVTLLRESMELDQTDLKGMMNRTNLAIIGEELINFAEADQDSSGDWVIGYFLRGRKGSEITTHAAEERFVLLERANLLFIEADLYMLDADLTIRATSLGTSNQDEQTVTFNGLSQTERQPAYLKAYRDGGNIEISWQGVGRKGGGVNISMGKYFTGYRVTVNGTSQDTTDLSLTVTDPGGTVTITVQQLNDLTGAGEEIEVII